MKRAAFLLALAALPGVARAEYMLECASGDYDYTYCPAETRYGVELAEVLSNAGCVIGDSWGYDAGGVWVDNGCRGRFRIFAAGDRGQGSDEGTADLIPPGVLGQLRADDADDGREPGYGRADAVIACAYFAQGEETARGSRSIAVQSVEQVVPRGRRAYDVKFTVAVEAASGTVRAARARCTVENAAVTSYSRF